MSIPDADVEPQGSKGRNDKARSVNALKFPVRPW